MSLTFTFGFVNTPPFYSGSPLSTLVPDVFPLGIDGRPYLIDQKAGSFARGFEQRVRDSVDQSTAPGEAAINPGGLWRRGEVSWHYGAGQKYADTAESQDYRFNTSKGVNVWAKGQLTLLEATKLSLSSTTTTQHMVVQDGRVYVGLDEDVKYTTDPYASSPTWTDCTGEPGSGKKVNAMMTDGHTVYIAFQNDGIRGILPSSPGTIGGPSSNHYVNSSDNYYMMGFAKGFMFVAYNHILYNLSSGMGLTDIITPFEQVGFTWVGVATGQNAIYAAGYSGKKSLIYKITIKTDGSLDGGVVALELPTGEVVSTISDYLGYIFIGTNKGVRFCTADSNSNLVAGQIIPTSGTVKKFTADGKYAWFTWSNFDGVSTGLGRLDLSTFTAPNTPAFASDLMYTSTADVLDLVTFNNKRCFAVSGVGVVAEDSANLVASGYLESGRYRWGIPDRKFVARVDTRSTPLVGSIKTEMSLDGQDYTTLGTWDSSGDTENSFAGSDDKTIEAQFKFTLTRATATTGPTMTRWTSRAYAAPFRSEFFRLPLLLHKQLRVQNKDFYFNVDEELRALRNLVADPRIITLQLGNETVSVIMEDLEWVPVDWTGYDWDYEGTATVTMRSVEE